MCMANTHLTRPWNCICGEKNTCYMKPRSHNIFVQCYFLTSTLINVNVNYYWAGNHWNWKSGIHLKPMPWLIRLDRWIWWGLNANTHPVHPHHTQPTPASPFLPLCVVWVWDWQIILSFISPICTEQPVPERSETAIEGKAFYLKRRRQRGVISLDMSSLSLSLAHFDSKLIQSLNHSF